jgi:tetratricopeptide (TPR) repeat protein
VILYAILTGRSPYRESPPADPLKPVRDAAFVPPQQRDPGVPGALAAICLKAMAARPEQRYTSARALAEDLARWLADEPVSAWHEPYPLRARRWVRRHQRGVVGVSAALLVAILALLGVTAVTSMLNRTIRQKNDEITRQYQDLEKTNRDLSRARTEAEAQRDQAREVSGFLVSSFRKPDPAQDGRKVTVVDVLDGAVKELDQRKIHPATQATILNAVGETYRGLGLVPQAVEILEKSLALRRRELGDEDPETLVSQHNLALASGEAGSYERAIELLQRTLATRRARLGEQHLDTLATINDLAVAYHDAGQVDRAIPLYQQVLALRETIQGPDDPETLTSLNNLGTAYQDAGRTELAIPLLDRALRAQQAKLGKDHPETLTTLNNLALALQRAGQFDRAVPLHEQELAASRARLGDDHPATLISMNNLATAYLEAGQLDRAIPLLEQTLRAKTSKLGDDHPSVLVTLRNLARGYEKIRRPQDAERLFRRAIASSGRQKPRDDGFYSDMLAMLGRCLIHQQEIKEAVAILRECLEIKAKNQPDDWTTANVRSLLGEALAAQRSYQEAEPLLLAAQKALVERRDKIRPLDRDATLRDAVDRLVRLYQAWGKRAESETWKNRLPPAQPSASTGPK